MILIFSAGCKLYSFDDDLLWLEPIEFSLETKDWLLERSPWPEYVREDFNKIAVLNDSIRAIKNID